MHSKIEETADGLYHLQTMYSFPAQASVSSAVQL